MSRIKIEKELKELSERRISLMLDFTDNVQYNKLHDALQLSEDKKDACKWQNIHNKISNLERRLSVSRRPELQKVTDRIKELKPKL